MPNASIYDRAPVNPDVKRAFEVLSGKTKHHTEYWKYYDGEAPVPFASDRMRELFQKINIYVAENWSAVVIDAVSDRISLQGFTIADNKAAEEQLNTLVSEIELLLEADDAHRAALVTGEAYIIAWKDDEVDPDDRDSSPSGIQCYFNDGRLCHIFTDPENPQRKVSAAKWWDDAEDRRRLTLYYPDRLEYYVSSGKAENLTDASGFKQADPPEAENPFGRVPVFALQPERRRVKSDLKNVVPLHDAVNMLLIDLMVTAETSALPQKYAITGAEIPPGLLKSGPDIVWEFPASDGMGQPTQVGQFQPTDLNNFLQAMDNLVNAISSITRTPKHYFVKGAGDPSGEALIAMESPNVKKAQDRIDRFTPVWRKIGAFLCELLGQEIEAVNITPRWADPKTVQPRTEAEVVQIGTGSGIPLKTALRRSGWTQGELDEMEADKKQEDKAKADTLAKALVDQQRNFDQGNGTQDGAVPSKTSATQGRPQEQANANRVQSTQRRN